MVCIGYKSHKTFKYGHLRLICYHMVIDVERVGPDGQRIYI